MREIIILPGSQAAGQQTKSHNDRTWPRTGSVAPDIHQKAFIYDKDVAPEGVGNKGQGFYRAWGCTCYA